MTDSVALTRVPTGISGFDQVALGGLPAGRATLVSGTTGSGKTLFAIEFLARGIQDAGTAGVFVTFEETPEDIRRNATALGWPIEGWEAQGSWLFLDATVDIAEEAPTVGHYDLSGLLSRIEHAIRQISATRVSVDSLGAIFTRFPDVGLVRHELMRISSTLQQFGVTSVLTSERTGEYDGVSRFGVEEFVISNVIILRNVLHQERRRRTVEIVKFRGAPHRNGEWLFAIDPQEGIVVIPLALITPRKRASRERVSSGNAGLDAMCGGGFYRDAIVLMSGPTGSGKTLSSLFFADAAYRAGQRCLLYTFDETRDQLGRNASGWGLDLDAMEASGLLMVRAEYPETTSMEDHFIQLRRTVEDFQPHRLVIDTLSALERIVSPRGLLDFIIALDAVLRPKEVTALLTSAPSGRVTPAVTPAIAVEIASLADVTILLRDFESQGRIHRSIAVTQTRGSAHDPTIREVTVDSDGMHIGESVHTYAGILTRGAPPPPTRTGPPEPPENTEPGGTPEAGNQG
jgi:circadian clock protein KaiC